MLPRSSGPLALWIGGLAAAEDATTFADWIEDAVAIARVLLPEVRAEGAAAEGSPLFLAAIVAWRRSRQGTAAAWARKHLRRDLREAVPYLVVAATAARLMGVTSPSWMDDGDAAGDLIGWADAFIAGVAPRHPGFLVLADRNREARVNHFLSLRDATDENVLEATAAALVDAGLADASEARECVRSIGARRLRTIPVSLLTKIVDNQRTWRPLVELLAGTRSATVELNEELRRLSTTLTERLRSRWRSQDPSVAEDVVQDVFATVMDRLRKPDHGYTYEGDLPGWLAAIAENRLRGLHRKPRPGSLLEDGEGHSAAEAPPMTEGDSLHREWRARYLVVETYFKRPTVPRVKAIWEWMLLHDDPNLESNESPGLKAYVDERTGETNPDTLAGTVRRLRMRLDAVRYVRDEVALENAEDSDRAMLEFVDGRHGLAKVDEPTLRGIAALARACRRPCSVHWGRLAKLVIEGNDEECGAIPMALKEAWKEGRGSADAIPRIDRLIRRTLRDRDDSVMRQLRREAKEERMAFLLAPCWCLAALGVSTADEAVRRLAPDSRGSAPEEPWIRRMMAAFRPAGTP